MVSRCGEGSAFTVIKEIIVDAEIKNVGKVENFTGDFFNKVARDKINPSRAYVVIDEIFSNIAYYAYPNGKGEVTVRLEWEDETSLFTITFIDKGVQFDPIKKMDPDITLSAEERKIGGLGIFIVKRIAKFVKYEYKDEKNILSVTLDR